MLDRKPCKCGCGQIITRKMVEAQGNKAYNAFARRKFYNNACRLKWQKSARGRHVDLWHRD